MQSLQNAKNTGFLTPEGIAEKLVAGYQRRERRSKEKSEEVFVSSGEFFYRLIEDWVKERRDTDIQDRRSLPRAHKIAGFMDCNDLVDEWWRCFLTIPFDSSPLFAPPQPGFTSPFLFKKHAGDINVAKVYMIGLFGFKSPDVRRIVVGERVPILIPVYNASAAAEEQLWDPNRQAVSVEESDISRTLTEIVVDDLCGLYHMEAKFDKKPIKGFTVLRNVSYQVPNIPKDNVRGVPSERLGTNRSMKVCHGGFYILLNPDTEVMNSGEHLLYFKALSVNYEVEAKIHIGIIAT
ncbi:MAG: hypothetical protein ACRD5E_14330 [Nitrososphaeraceae archaeon]